MKSRITIAIVLCACLFSRADWRLDFDDTFAKYKTPAWTPASLNPVAWWSFESTNGAVNVDSIGGKTMTLVGGPAVGTGIRGNCITTAAGKYGTWTEFSSATNFSYSLWLKTGSPASDMIFIGASASSTKFLEKLTATTLIVRFGGESAIGFTSPAFGTGWRMYTLTCEGNNTRVYIDGVESVSGVRTVTGANINIFNQIGKFNANNSVYFWNGQIDEMTVYNYTLSQAQITQLYEYK